MIKFLLFIFLISLVSCDPGFGVSLYNNSKEDKEIKVLDYDSLHLRYVDSLLIFDESNSDSIKSEWQTIVAKNFSENSYVFLLKSGKTALLRRGIGRPKADLSDILSKVIINNSDTIIIKNDKRVKVNRRFMSTKAVISIQ